MSTDVCFEGADNEWHILREEESKIPFGCLMWLLLRKVGVRHIFGGWNAGQREKAIAIAVAINSPQLLSLRTHCVSKWSTNTNYLSEVGRRCINLVKLTLRDSVNESNSDMDAVVAQAVMFMPKLKVIGLWKCHVSNLTLTALGENCHDIRELNLSGNRDITDEGLGALAEGCPLIEKLNLSECSEITDEGIKTIANFCTSLISLDLSGCDDNITDDSIKYLATQCSLLKYIDLAFCDEITDSSIIAIADHCRNLKSINITNIDNEGIGDESIVKLAENCNELEEVIFEYCLLTNESVLAFAKYCPRLKVINVAEIVNITDEAIIKLAEGCQELELVNVRGCIQITNDSLEKLGDCCPFLKSVRSWDCPLVTEAARNKLEHKLALS